MKKITKNLKKKLKIYNPKLHEECGVFGISNADDASALTALGLEPKILFIQLNILLLRILY